MIVGTFGPHTEEGDKAARLAGEPTSNSIFALLSLPFFVQVDERGPRIGSDKDRPRKLKTIKRAFRVLMVEEKGENSVSRKLAPEGGELVLEDEPFKVVKAVWEEFKALLPISSADEIVAVDDWLEDVASFTESEWKAEIEKRATASAVPAPAATA